MSCKPTYKGVRYNSLEELYNANGVNDQQKQQVQQLYSQYLNTIFPDSKVKDIVYHGANEPIEGERFIKREGATGGGIWFSGSRKYAQIQMDRVQPSESLIGRKLRGAPTMYQVILNIKNPKNFYDATGALLVQTPREFEKQYDRTVNDAALFHHPNSKKPETADSADQVVVFEPEQIHILGSKQDIEGFKEFIDNNQSTSLTDDEIGVVKDTIIKRLLKNEENSEKSITFAEINKSLGGRLSNALKGSSKTPEELWSNLSSEGKVQLIDCL